MSQDPTREQVAEIRKDVHELAVKLAAETVRRSSENGVLKDVLADVREALKHVSTDVRTLLERTTEMRTELAHMREKYDRLHEEVAGWRAEAAAEHSNIHGRITKAIEYAREQSMGAERRVMTFLREWGPVIIAGLMVLSGVGYLAVRGGG